jgi:hypothetical protein
VKGLSKFCSEDIYIYFIQLVIGMGNPQVFFAIPGPVPVAGNPQVCNIWIFKVQYVEYGGELWTDEPQIFVRLLE